MVNDEMTDNDETTHCWRSKLMESKADAVERLTVNLDTAEEVPGELVHLMAQGIEDTMSGGCLCRGLALTKHGQEGNVYRRVGTALYTFRSHEDMEEYIVKFPRETVSIT